MWIFVTSIESVEKATSRLLCVYGDNWERVDERKASGLADCILFHTEIPAPTGDGCAVPRLWIPWKTGRWWCRSNWSHNRPRWVNVWDAIVEPQRVLLYTKMPSRLDGSNFEWFGSSSVLELDAPDEIGEEWCRSVLRRHSRITLPQSHRPPHEERVREYSRCPQCGLLLDECTNCGHRKECSCGWPRTDRRRYVYGMHAVGAPWT